MGSIVKNGRTATEPGKNLLMPHLEDETEMARNDRRSTARTTETAGVGGIGRVGGGENVVVEMGEIGLDSTVSGRPDRSAAAPAIIRLGQGISVIDATHGDDVLSPRLRT